MAAATAAHLTDASGVEIAVPSVAVGLGGVGGLAFGAMLPDSGHQPMRVGAFSGALAVGAASLALARPLRLHEGFAIPGTAGATVVGLTLGTGNGLLLAGLLDPSGSFELIPDRQAVGGIVFGQALGATTGFLWTRFFQPDGADGAAAITGSVFGASLGWGLAHAGHRSRGRSRAARSMGRTAGWRRRRRWADRCWGWAPPDWSSATRR